MKSRLKAYLALIRFDKPVGSFLLLWPALWGLLLAKPELPQLGNLIIFVCGVFLMRSAGCAINDFADRNIDGLVARTALRPLVQGVIQPWEAIVVAAVFVGFSFCLVLLTNRLTILLSLCAVIFAGLYPFTKRWIQSPQLVLGVAFAWSIPMGFAAELEEVPWFAWLLFFSVVLWIISYDTYYALADRRDDECLNIGSTALLFKNKAEIVSFICNCMFIVLFLVFFLCFISQQLHDIVWILFGASIAFGCAVYQYQLALTQMPDKCIKAFKLNNITGLSFSLCLFATRL